MARVSILDRIRGQPDVGVILVPRLGSSFDPATFLSCFLNGKSSGSASKATVNPPSPSRERCRPRETIVLTDRADLATAVGTGYPSGPI
jgi:hypothetical protein